MANDTTNSPSISQNLSLTMAQGMATKDEVTDFNAVILAVVPLEAMSLMLNIRCDLNGLVWAL